MSDDGGMFEVPGDRLRELTSEISTLRGFVQDELVYLWGQLIDAYRAYLGSTWMGQPPGDWRVGNEHWSMRCDGLATRIAAATALVGPVSSGDIQIPALVDGWYEWANRKIGITNPDMPSEEQLARCREYVESQMRLL